MSTTAPPVRLESTTTHVGVKRAPLRVHTLAVVNLLTLTVLTASSWGMAVLVPAAGNEPLEAAWFARLAESSGLSFVAGDWFLADRLWFVAFYVTLVAITSLVFVSLLSRLAAQRAQLGTRDVDVIHRWAIVFAVVLVFAVPVLVQDFWLSAGWGRLLRAGGNPYYVHLDPAVTAGLPLDYLGLFMTYGPLWALVSAGVMVLAGDSGLLAGLLFKLVLGGAWLVALMLVRRLVAHLTAWHQCVALLIAGWLPLTLIQVVAEGHNDIVMVALILAWLVWLERRRALSATAALAASVTMKYMSAPLFVLDLLHHWRGTNASLMRYAPRALIAAVIGFGTLAVFYRSPEFFSATTHMTEWHFLTPRDAIVALGRLAGVEPGFGSIAGMLVAGMAVLLQLFFIGIAVLGVARYVADPDAERFRRAVLALSTGILFGVVGHLWPWFLTWMVFIASLQPAHTLTRWTVGVALAAPLPLMFWVMFPSPDLLMMVTPPFYAFAALWFFKAPASWFWSTRAGQSPARHSSDGAAVPLNAGAALP